jgi:hypothetical protein
MMGNPRAGFRGIIELGITALMQAWELTRATGETYSCIVLDAIRYYRVDLQFALFERHGGDALAVPNPRSE